MMTQTRGGRPGRASAGKQTEAKSQQVRNVQQRMRNIVKKDTQKPDETQKHFKAENEGRTVFTLANNKNKKKGSGVPRKRECVRKRIKNNKQRHSDADKKVGRARMRKRAVGTRRLPKNRSISSRRYRKDIGWTTERHGQLKTSKMVHRNRRKNEEIKRH